MNRRPIRVFLASPGDVEEERQVFRDLLLGLSTRAEFEFMPLGFEDLLGSTGPRPQDLINSLLDECDIFISLLHRRWGQSSINAVGYTAYTEEEFQRALRRFNATGTPQIICFFKHVELAALADPGEQLEKVLTFKSSLAASGRIMYQTYSSVQDFRSQIERHVLSIARGELPALQRHPRKIHVPILADHEPEHGITQELALVEQAASAARSGHTEEASVLFAKVSQTSRNVQVLDTARAFFVELGNPDAAQSLFERKLTLLRDRRLAAREYLAVMNRTQWLDEVVAAMPNEEVATKLRSQLSSDRFREQMIQHLAEYFTVGELLALARFYGGEGSTISAKFGRAMAALPQFLAQFQNDEHRLV